MNFFSSEETMNYYIRGTPNGVFGYYIFDYFYNQI